MSLGPEMDELEGIDSIDLDLISMKYMEELKEFVDESEMSSVIPCNDVVSSRSSILELKSTQPVKCVPKRRVLRRSLLRMEHDDPFELTKTSAKQPVQPVECQVAKLIELDDSNSFQSKVAPLDALNDLSKLSLVNLSSTDSPCGPGLDDVEPPEALAHPLIHSCDVENDDRKNGDDDDDDSGKERENPKSSNKKEMLLIDFTYSPSPLKSFAPAACDGKTFTSSPIDLISKDPQSDLIAISSSTMSKTCAKCSMETLKVIAESEQREKENERPMVSAMKPDLLANTPELQPPTSDKQKDNGVIIGGYKMIEDTIRGNPMSPLSITSIGKSSAKTNPSRQRLTPLRPHVIRAPVLALRPRQNGDYNVTTTERPMTISTPSRRVFVSQSRSLLPRSPMVQSYRCKPSLAASNAKRTPQLNATPSSSIVRPRSTLKMTSSEQQQDHRQLTTPLKTRLAFGVHRPHESNKESFRQRLAATQSANKKLTSTAPLTTANANLPRNLNSNTPFSEGKRVFPGPQTTRATLLPRAAILNEFCPPDIEEPSIERRKEHFIGHTWCG